MERPIMVSKVKLKSNMTPEKEDEFNEWYNKVHLEDALKIPGLFAGHRYKGTEKGHYLTIYEIENKEMIDKVLSSKKLAEAGEDFSERWKGYMDWEIAVYTHIYTASK